MLLRFRADQCRPEVSTGICLQDESQHNHGKSSFPLIQIWQNCQQGLI